MDQNTPIKGAQAKSEIVIYFMACTLHLYYILSGIDLESVTVYTYSEPILQFLYIKHIFAAGGC